MWKAGDIKCKDGPIGFFEVAIIKSFYCTNCHRTSTVVIKTSKGSYRDRVFCDGETLFLVKPKICPYCGMESLDTVHIKKLYGGKKDD